jgi:hypothetical protein
MPEGKNIPHVENVRLVKKSTSHAGAPGFSFQFASIFTTALLILFLLAYFLLI